MCSVTSAGPPVNVGSADDTRRFTIAAVEQALFALGFERGIPPFVGAYSLAVDRLICQEWVCYFCGRKGVEYRPYRTDREYRVLAHCPRCSHAEEM
jgi:hypothetical protein